MGKVKTGNLWTLWDMENMWEIYGKSYRTAPPVMIVGL
jgi:hypothetical protein